MKRILPLLLLLALLPVTANAHPGSLDENGGHWDRKAGTYHYHEGLNTTGSGSNSSQSYGFYSEYDSSYDEGYDYGKARGYASGHDEGWDEGYQYGLEAGRKEGNARSGESRWTTGIVVSVCWAIAFFCYRSSVSNDLRDYKSGLSSHKAAVEAEKQKIRNLEDEKFILRQKLDETQKKLLVEQSSGRQHKWEMTVVNSKLYAAQSNAKNWEQQAAQAQEELRKIPRDAEYWQAASRAKEEECKALKRELETVRRSEQSYKADFHRYYDMVLAMQREQRKKTNVP